MEARYPWFSDDHPRPLTILVARRGLAFSLIADERQKPSRPREGILKPVSFPTWYTVRDRYQARAKDITLWARPELDELPERSRGGIPRGARREAETRIVVRSPLNSLVALDDLHVERTTQTIWSGWYGLSARMALLDAADPPTPHRRHFPLKEFAESPVVPSPGRPAG